MLKVYNWATPGPYEKLAEDNAAKSYELSKVKIETIKIEGVGNWCENTCLKPQVALQAISRLKQGELCILIDADAYVSKEPEWRECTGMFGFVRWRRPSSGALVCLSGTLLLSSSNQCKDFLEGWKSRCDLHPEIWDQAHLWESVKADTSGLITELGWQWAWMQGNSLEDQKGAWICHDQASRELKGQPDTAPLVPSETDHDLREKTGGKRKKV